MRTWSLLSGVGVAIVAAWLAVTNLAQAAEEFTCVIPWHGPTDSCFPTLKIPARGQVKIEVYTVQKKSSGEDVGGPVTFQILDTENNNVPVYTLYIPARSTGSWVYESSQKLLVAQIRTNHSLGNDVVVRGRYWVQ
jgi:hypothetical protein